MPFCFSQQLMDGALLSKFLFLNASFIILTILLLLKKTRLPLNISIIDVVFGTFVFWQSLSIIWAHNFSEAVFSAATAFLFLLSYVYGKYVLNSNDQATKFIFPAIGLCALLLSLYGWHQFFSIPHLSKSGDVYLVKGFSAHKNLFVTQFFLLLPFLSIGFFKAKTKLKYFYLLVIALILLLQFSLLARAFFIGLIGAVLVSAVLLFIKRTTFTSFKFIKPILFGVPVMAILLFVVFSITGGLQLLDRYNFKNYKTSRNAKERIAIWNNTIELIKDKPVLGHGAGNWDVFFASKGIGNIPRMAVLGNSVARPHNDYLWITSETGLIGILLYLALLVLIYWQAIISIVKSTDFTHTVSLILLVAALTGYLIIAFFDFPRERIELNLYFGMLLALLLFYAKKDIPGKYFYTIPANIATALKIVALVVLCFIFYIGCARYSGEVRMNKIGHFSEKVNFNKVISETKDIKNMFYTIDAKESPVDYYACSAYFEKGDYKNTIAYGQKALEVSPFHQNSLLKIAASYGELKNYPECVTYFKSALIINPQNNKTKESLAVCYYNGGQKEEARQLVKTFESTHPTILEMQRIFNSE